MTAAEARPRARMTRDVVWPGLVAVAGNRRADIEGVTVTASGSLWLKVQRPDGAVRHGLIASAREIADGSFKALFARRVNGIMAAAPQEEPA